MDRDTEPLEIDEDLQDDNLFLTAVDAHNQAQNLTPMSNYKKNTPKRLAISVEKEMITKKTMYKLSLSPLRDQQHSPFMKRHTLVGRGKNRPSLLSTIL